MLEKEFIPYEQSQELKELGFDEDTMCVYNSYKHLKSVIISSMDGDYVKREKWEDRLPAPTFSQAFRWFREKYNLDSFVKHLYISTIKVGYYFGIDQYKGIEFQMGLVDCYKTYEEAELACLKKLIEIVKSK